MARAIFGLDPYDEGEVWFLERRILLKPWEALGAGLMLYRRTGPAEGGILGLPVRWNATFSMLDGLKKGWTLDEGTLRRRVVAEVIQRVICSPS